MRLAGVALLVLGCSGGTFTAEGGKGGAAGMAGSAAGVGGSAGESPQGGAGMASGGSPAGQGGMVATAGGGAGEAAGGPATGGAGVGGESAAGGLGGVAVGQGGGAAGELVAGMGGVGGESSAGSSGASLCGSDVGAASYMPIDDLEDGDGIVGNGEGHPSPPKRVGRWFAGNTTPDDCVQVPQGNDDFLPAPGPDDGSMFAARTVGSGCEAAWIGLYLSACEEPRTYDASAYDGITFRYRSSQDIRVELPTLANLSLAAGGECSDLECDNHHGKNFMATGSWASGTITWAELSGSAQIGSPPAKPQPAGTPRQFKPEELFGVQFRVDGVGAASFDLWVDDVRFL